MDTRDPSTALDPASEAVLQAQREMLTRLVAELLASQRAALTALQSEMERTNEELSHRRPAHPCPGSDHPGEGRPAVRADQPRQRGPGAARKLVRRARQRGVPAGR